MKKLLQNDLFTGLVLALIAFIVYFLTLSPSIGFIDNGELATVATTLGIAHPTGYPLFTLIGWLFVHLPLGHRVIWNMNLLSALLCSASIYFFYRVFLLFLSNASPLRAGEKRSFYRIAAATGVLSLAFSRTFWSQALSIEVYPLHILFLSVVLLLFLRAVLGNKETAKEPPRTWLLFALCLGLSFTNHMTTILLAPGFLYLFFATYGTGRPAWNKIGMAAIPFLLGLSLYLYLPLRDRQGPMLNWGSPSNLVDFWKHVSGERYHLGMFSSLEVASNHFKAFVTGFPYEFAFLPALFALAGLIQLFLRSRRMFVFTLLLFGGCLLYAINYNIRDLDSYFLLAYVVTGVWVACGALWVLEVFRSKGLEKIGWAVCAVAVLLPLALHYSDVDESKDYAVEDYARNVLASVDSGGVIFSSQWEYFTSAALYLQIVEGVRPDVTVIDKELLSSAWYYPQLERRYPGFMAQSKKERDSFLAELYKFDHDLPCNPRVLKARMEDMVHSFVAKSLDSKPVYVTADMGPDFAPGFLRVPSGLTLRLFLGAVPKPTPPREFVFRPLATTIPDVENIRTNYAIAYANQGIYQSMLGDTVTSLEFLRKSLAVKPDFPQAVAWLERLGGR